MAYLRIKNRDELDDISLIFLERIPECSTKQERMMLHAIGADHRPLRRTSYGQNVYFAYRNYYDAGGTDIEQWDDLVEKGYAANKGVYKVTTDGLRYLEIVTGGSIIYDDYSNYADCRNVILDEYIINEKYGQLPMSAVAVAKKKHIPIGLARQACRNLANEGYLKANRAKGQSVFGDYGYDLTEKGKMHTVAIQHGMWGDSNNDASN